VNTNIVRTVGTIVPAVVAGLAVVYAARGEWGLTADGAVLAVGIAVPPHARKGGLRAWDGGDGRRPPARRVRGPDGGVHRRPGRPGRGRQSTCGPAVPLSQPVPAAARQVDGYVDAEEWDDDRLMDLMPLTALATPPDEP